MPTFTDFKSGVTRDFYEAFFRGIATSADVPYKFPVGIGGRGYLLDLKTGLFRRYSIPVLRQQADGSSEPGEASISLEDLWRRAQEDWSSGAGQVWYDRPDSNRRRFRTSKGIDVWTRYQISLLNDTTARRASTNTNLQLVVAGSRVYLTDGTALLFSTSTTLASFTAVTGSSATAANGMATNGFNVWTIHGADGLYQTSTSSGATAKGVTGNLRGMLAYVKGRIIASDNNAIYNITTIDTGTPAALPAALMTHDNTDFEWVAAAEGPGQVYLAGQSGGNSEIYRTEVKADGTALDVPVMTSELPDGEVVRSMRGYLGFIVIGTDKGVRFAQPNDSGDLLIGGLIATDNPVRAFEPQDRFVWFGQENYDSSSTGLERLDLSTFTETLRPAFASDLMYAGQGQVSSIITWDDKRAFTVQGAGVIQETTNKVSEGTLDSGLIRHGVPDKKIAFFVDVRPQGTIEGTITIHLSTDGGSFENLGNRTSASADDPISASETRGDVFELRTELDRSSTDNTLGPTVSRITLSSYPAPMRGQIIILPLLMHEAMVWRNSRFWFDVRAEVDFLRGLEASRALSQIQIGDEILPAIIEEVDERFHKSTDDQNEWNSTVVVKAKVFSNT